MDVISACNSGSQPLEDDTCKLSSTNAVKISYNKLRGSEVGKVPGKSENIGDSARVAYNVMEVCCRLV